MAAVDGMLAVELTVRLSGGLSLTGGYPESDHQLSALT